ncbi:copper resistance CopC family protein [Salinifilum ghardaiensis]
MTPSARSTRTARVPHRPARLLVVALVTLLAGLGGAGTASAHNTLVDSDPADGAQLRSGPGDVRLVYDQPVREGYNTVSVTGPHGGHWTGGEARVRGNEVTVPVRELGPAGEYTVGYRVLSNDGHPVTGEITFRLAREQGGSPAPPPESSADGAEAGGGAPAWPWIAGAAVLVAIGAGLALRLGRPGR